MSKDFVRSKDNVKNIDTEKVDHTEVNDLLHDNTYSYIHTPKHKFHNLLDNVKQIIFSSTKFLSGSKVDNDFTIDTSKLDKKFDDIDKVDLNQNTSLTEIKQELAQLQPLKNLANQEFLRMAGYMADYPLNISGQDVLVKIGRENLGIFNLRDGYGPFNTINYPTFYDFIGTITVSWTGSHGLVLPFHSISGIISQINNFNLLDTSVDFDDLRVIVTFELIEGYYYVRFRGLGQEKMEMINNVTIAGFYNEVFTISSSNPESPKVS